MRTLLALVLCAFISGAHLSPCYAAIVRDEVMDGDLSTDPNSPTAITFDAGSNVIQGSIMGPNDVRDYITFTIPTGFALAELNQLQYVTLPEGGPGNRGFHAIINGSTSFVPDAANIGGFLGGNHLDPLPVGTDMLPSLATATLGGSGFTIPLGPGTYTYHVQQTSPILTGYSLDFVIVPEPMSAGIMATGLMSLLVARRLRRLQT